MLTHFCVQDPFCKPVRVNSETLVGSYFFKLTVESLGHHMHSSLLYLELLQQSNMYKILQLAINHY